MYVRPDRLTIVGKKSPKLTNWLFILFSVIVHFFIMLGCWRGWNKLLMVLKSGGVHDLSTPIPPPPHYPTPPPLSLSLSHTNKSSYYSRTCTPDYNVCLTLNLFSVLTPTPPYKGDRNICLEICKISSRFIDNSLYLPAPDNTPRNYTTHKYIWFHIQKQLGNNDRSMKSTYLFAIHHHILKTSIYILEGRHLLFGNVTACRELDCYNIFR